MNDKLALKLTGLVDARTQRGQFARGKNIYMGASHAPRTGSKADVGNTAATSKRDLSKQAIARRLRKVRGGKQTSGGSNG